jgi:hypothetical protein
LIRITTKRQMYELYNAGLLGNGLRNWPTLDECCENATGLVGVRCRRIGGPCIAMKTPDELRAAMREVYAQGWRPEDFIYGESPDHHHQLIQGEVQRSERHYDLTYSTVQAPMRVALAQETRYAQGAAVPAILRAYLWPSSYDDMMDLLDIYDGAVVEFTSFDCELGRYPNRNTIIWEVRHY